MTLSIKPGHDGKKPIDEEHYHKLNVNIATLIILISGLGVAVAIVISTIYGSAIFIDPNSSPSISEPIPEIERGSVSGFVMDSYGLPLDGASVPVYKQMGLMNSVDKNAGYSTSVVTESDGSYTLDSLPSGVYRFTVTYPDNTIQTLDNYAIWPSSSSSYVFKAKESS